MPDVDTLVHLTGDPTAVLMRRTFGHSILTMPLWALALSFVLYRIFPDLRFFTIYSITLLGAALHLFFDLVNSFGIVLLWPFSLWRPELATIFIIDLFLTGLLAAPLLLIMIRKIRPYLEVLSRVSIGCVLIYILFCGSVRSHAMKLLTSKSQHTGMQPDFMYVFPEPLGPHRWRGVLREKDIYRIFLIHPLSNRMEFIKEVSTGRNNPLVRIARNSALGSRIEWFFKAPVWTLNEGPKGNESVSNNPAHISVYDLRFNSVLINRKTPFVYNFLVHKDGRVKLKKMY